MTGLSLLRSTPAINSKLLNDYYKYYSDFLYRLILFENILKIMMNFPMGLGGLGGMGLGDRGHAESVNKPDTS